MTYPKKLLRLRPRKGLASDGPDWTIPQEFFTQAENIVFRLGVAERAPSSAAVYDPPSVAPYCLLNTQIAGTNYWIYVGATASYAVETSNHTAITHASGQASQTDVSKISLGLLNSVPYFNNALDEPMYWDGNVSNNFVDLPGWTTGETCEIMIAHKFHLFALNLSEVGGDYPEKVAWSDAAAPGNVPASWTASASNEAGDAILASTPGAILSAANLRDSLAIYKQGATHLADYIGGSEIYAFRTAFHQAGALTRHAVADINGRHLVVTDGDIIIHDGQQVASIAQARRRRYLFNSIDEDNYQKLFVVNYRAKGEVWICFPEAGSSQATRAMIYDTVNDAWGDRELPGINFAATGLINDTAVDQTWDVDTEVWNDDTSPWNLQNFSNSTEALVLAEPDGPDFLQIETGTETLTSVLARHDLDFGEPERFKFLRRIHFRTEADVAVDFSVRVGTRNATGESISWGNSVAFNSDDGYVNILAMGRLLSVELTTTTSSPFKITGIDLEAEIRGYH